jgi:hypothetical protein
MLKVFRRPSQPPGMHQLQLTGLDKNVNTQNEAIDLRSVPRNLAWGACAGVVNSTKGECLFSNGDGLDK